MTAITPGVAKSLLEVIWELNHSRIDALVRVANEVVVDRPPSWDKAAIRAAKPEHEKPATCFACSHQFSVLYWHHIITVDHGGDNDPFNVVAICHRCHRTIHPWLTEEEFGGLMPVESWFKAMAKRMRRVIGGPR